MQTHFDKVAKDWDMNDLKSQLSYHIGKALLEHTTLRSNMHIMDFGAGTGLLTVHVADKVQKVAAVDISEAMLNELMAKTHLASVKAYCQDIIRQPINEDFDGIISAMALHHVKDTDEIIKAFYGHLNDGGFIAIADLDSEDGTFHPEEMDGVFHHGFDRLVLQKKFEDAGFKDVEFRTAHTFVKEDKSEYPIFLLTAKK